MRKKECQSCKSLNNRLNAETFRANCLDKALKSLEQEKVLAVLEAESHKTKPARLQGEVVALERLLHRCVP